MQGIALRFASVLDHDMLLDEKSSWTTLIAIRSKAPALCQSYWQSRAKTLEHLGQVDVDATADVNQLQSLASQIGHPVVIIEALQLSALDSLLMDRYDQAWETMSQALTIAQQAALWPMASELALSCTDIARRQGNDEGERASWSTAIHCELKRLGAPNQTVNPNFWLRADDAMPQNYPWPDECRSLIHYTSSLNLPAIDPAAAQPAFAIRCAIMAAQFERGQYQACLLQSKKAESLTEGNLADLIRIVQAKCMAAIGSSSTAIAMLSKLSGTADPQVKTCALAALGSHRVSTWAFENGHRYLQRSITQPEINSFTSIARSRVLADFAIAQLILGQQKEGLENLRQAQSQFLADSAVVDYSQAIENEIRFLSGENQKIAIHDAQQRRDAFEQKWLEH